jgi:hypothetical protein
MRLQRHNFAPRLKMAPRRGGRHESETVLLRRMSGGGSARLNQATLLTREGISQAEVRKRLATYTSHLDSNTDSSRMQK